MKKNYTIVFIAVAVLIVLCAFWGCSSSDDDDDGPSLPNAEDGFLGNGTLSIEPEPQVYSKTDGITPYTFTGPGTKSVRTRDDDMSLGSNYALGNNYQNAVAAISSIDEHGKLTLKLPAVTSWEDFNNGDISGVGITVNPPDVKVGELKRFFVSDTPEDLVLSYSYENINGESLVHYVYANQDASVSGVKTWTNSGDGNEYPLYMNLTLKQGWNSVLWIPFSNPEHWEVKTGLPGAGYKWVVQ
ncbi:MAG: hypothetical protein LBK13_03160 [Spirochaetales bacterium]|jgi:hypothetical protein|nr:hypothetical protein [Spirochaetales bacterium]